MRVARAPAGEKRAALVGLVVAVGVFEEQRVRRLHDDDAAIRENKSGGNAQLVCEHRELVRPPIALGVLANHDAIVARAGRLHFVRIIHGLGDPQPPAFIPRHRDGLLDLRIGGPELRREAGQRDEVFRGFLGGQRLLHLIPFRVALARAAGRVERDIRLLVLEGFQARLRRQIRHGAARGPAQAILEERLKTGVRPRALIVAPRGVKDAALTVRADPGVRLRALVVAALGEHGARLGIVRGVDVGFIPVLDRGEAPHDRMLGVHDGFLEDAGAVAFELAADERDEGGRISEARRRAVNRHEALAARDEIEQRLFLLGRELGVVGEDREHVVARERGGIQVVEFLGVGEREAARRERGVELLEALGGLVMPGVAEEEDVEAGGFGEWCFAGRGFGGVWFRGGKCGGRGEDAERDGRGAAKQNGERSGERRCFHCVNDGCSRVRTAREARIPRREVRGRIMRSARATMKFRGRGRGGFAELPWKDSWTNFHP